MAAKPVDRIRTMINELERGARTLGDDIRKRAGNVSMTSDIEGALRQLMQGLTNIAAQLEKAAGELRRYLEAGAKSAKKGARKTGSKRPAAKTTRKKAGSKAASKKATAKKAPAAAGKPARKPAKKKK
jgi:hypothetical protein